MLKIKGAQGGFYFDPEKHLEPLVLVSAGSGITPMMSISRFIRDKSLQHPVTFLHGARLSTDIIFHEECLKLAASESWFRYVVTLSQPDADWKGASGRIGAELVIEQVKELTRSRYFLCGPNEFMDAIRTALQQEGVPSDHIHTEQFHATPVSAMA
jgi:ferredoxin-NADP reductase